MVFQGMHGSRRSGRKPRRLSTRSHTVRGPVRTVSAYVCHTYSHSYSYSCSYSNASESLLAITQITAFFVISESDSLFFWSLYEVVLPPLSVLRTYNTFILICVHTLTVLTQVVSTCCGSFTVRRRRRKTFVRKCWQRFQER